MRVLIVEDEEGQVGALRIGLRREGCAVDAALALAEAQQKLAANAYDLVLLDVNLPDGQGFELADAVRGGHLEAGTAAGPAWDSPSRRIVESHEGRRRSRRTGDGLRPTPTRSADRCGGDMRLQGPRAPAELPRGAPGA